MARINLRPWREERNVALQKQFIINLVISALIGVLLVFGVTYYFNMQIERQQARNEYLRAESARLDREIREIQELNRRRAQLLERLEAIEQLQGTRPVIVRNFDELVRVIPDGLYYNSVVRSGQRVTIDGYSEQNRDVSNLMRNLESSIWFGEPTLSRVSASGVQRQFNLSVPMRSPRAEEAE